MDYQKLIGVNKKANFLEDDYTDLFHRLERCVEIITQLDSKEDIKLGSTLIHIIVYRIDKLYAFGELLKRLYLVVDRVSSVYNLPELEENLYRSILYSENFTNSKEVFISLFLELEDLELLSDEGSKNINRIITPKERKKL